MGDNREEVAAAAVVTSEDKQETKADITQKEIDESQSSTKDDLQNLPTAPDGGWGWVVVFAAFCVSIIVDGISYTFGIIKIQLMEETFNETSPATIALVGSLLSGVYLLVCPIAAAMSNKFGCRIVSMIGSVLAGVCFLISGFSVNIEMLLITYGILGGIGFGFMYLPTIVMVGYYFDKKRALATGIAVCGSGVGTFVMAPLVTALVEEYSWRGSNIILAGIILNGVVFATLYRPLPSTKIDQVEKDVEMDTINSSHIMQKIANDKRNRYYSGDENTVIAENGQIVSNGDASAGNHEHKKSSRSRTTSLNEPDGDKAFPRSRHVSRLSRVSVSGEEKKPFDRDDALYPGNLEKTVEFKDAGGNMAAYVNSMASIHHSSRAVDEVDKETSEQSSTFSFSSIRRVIMAMFDFSLLTSPTFILISVSGVFGFLGLFTPFVYTYEKAINQLEVPKQTAGYILVVIGVCNTVSRVVTGLISDFTKLDTVQIHNVAAIIAGVGTCLVALFNSYELLMFYAAIFGIFIAAFITLRSIVIVECMGVHKLTNAFGLLALFQGIAVLVGSPLAGALFEATESYNASFFLSGVLFAMAGAMCIPIRVVARWEARRKSGKYSLNNSTTAEKLLSPAQA